MTKELGLRLRGLRKRAEFTQSEQARKFAALRSRGEPSVPAQLDLDGVDRQFRRKWRYLWIAAARTVVFRDMARGKAGASLTHSKAVG